MMNVNSEMCKDGFKIRISKDYSIIYPSEKIWGSLKENTRLCLMDNITYAKMAPYAAIMNERIDLGTRKPLLKGFIDECIRKDLPRFAFQDEVRTGELRANLKASKMGFAKGAPIIPSEKKRYSDGALLALSFGKESLLSYSVMKEIGIPLRTVFIEDTWDIELFHKKALMGRFEKEFGEKVEILVDEFDNSCKDPLMRRIKSHGVYGSGAMNSYMLMLIPFIYHHQVNSIVFGNEQNFNNPFTNKEGEKCYPSYDQSGEWMLQQNKMLSKMTGGKARLISYVEPLYSIGEMKILLNRYPNAAKYMMSCAHEYSETSKSKWCNRCSDCATSFLYTVAFGHKPKELGFKENLLTKGLRKEFKLFRKKQGNPYNNAPDLRDSQLLGFYLAYKNKAKGYLIDEFKKKFLKEAIAREDELIKKYLGVHKALTIPSKHKQDVISIYREELSR